MSSVTYGISNEKIANPERGFYKYSQTSTNPYIFLEASTLQTYRTTDKISLLYRDFQLNKFSTKNLSPEFLENISQDFQTIRVAGLKVIVRFSYSQSESSAQRDASKLMILRHIQQLKPILQANSDVIAVVQAGFIGSWGEWYYTSQAEFGGWGFDEKIISPEQLANRKEIISALLDALPASRMIQLRNIDMKQNLFSIEHLTNKTAYSGSAASRIGFHNDCFLANDTDSGTFSNPSEQNHFLAQESSYVPVGGETCKLNAPRTDCSSAILEMQQFHWSFLNMDYYPEVIAGFRNNDCMNEIENNLGYRFQLQSALLPKVLGTADYLSISISLKNIGFAAPFNARKVFLILRNNKTGTEIKLPLSADPRYWFGKSEFTLNENLKLPKNTPKGNYSLFLSLPDDAVALAQNPAYAIQFANTNCWEESTGYNSLNHRITLKEGNIVQSTNKPFAIALYPIPKNREFLVSLPDCPSYQISFYKANGDPISINTVMDTNLFYIKTEGLPKGVYVMSVTKDGITDNRKFVVKK